MATLMREPPPELPQLTSTTAPGKIFATRGELAAHYKSPWHKYNLKRREAGLPPLLEADFEARLAAAQEALEASKLQKNQTAHVKKTKQDKVAKKKNNKKKHFQQQELENGAATVTSQAPAYERIKQQQEQREKEKAAGAAEEEKTGATPDGEEEAKAARSEEEEEPQEVEIDPRQSLFDRHVSASVHANVNRMRRKFGFFVPDVEYLIDLPGLIGYCHEKIQLGKLCLYCLKGFGTAQACQQHMVTVGHAKLRYELGYDLDEFDVFYDFKSANDEFMARYRCRPVTGEVKALENGTAGDDNNDEAAVEEWGDVSDDGADGDEDDEDDDEEGDDLYEGYEREVAAMGLDVTPLGELVFPDGRIIGHRAFRRYYKQRAPRGPDNRTSVVAARRAANDRLYQGRVVNLSQESAAALTTKKALLSWKQKQGLPMAPGAGKGLLVAAAGNHGFTQVSLYRYRAAVRKQRRQDAEGQRHYHRSAPGRNINHMDKKHNRLMNNVSVAHALR